MADSGDESLYVFLCVLKALLKYQEEHGEFVIPIAKIKALISHYDL